MTRIYISGPVTGKAGGNIRTFQDARSALTAAGYYANIPHDIIPDSVSHDKTMLLCLGDLTRYFFDDNDILETLYDGLALLPGWEQSEGAKLEKAVAEACGIPVKTVDEWIEDAS